jgi:hypothetical protein
MKNKETIEPAVPKNWDLYRYERGALYRKTLRGGFKGAYKWRNETTNNNKR